MQIIDGFTINALQLIDDRLVTLGIASRNAIVYKYNGLRVYDILANQPYPGINSSLKLIISGTGRLYFSYPRTNGIGDNLHESNDAG